MGSDEVGAYSQSTPSATEWGPPSLAATPPTARNRALSPTVTQQLIDAYAAGATIRSIARELDMRHVKMRARRGGIRRAGSGKR